MTALLDTLAADDTAAALVLRSARDRPTPRWTRQDTIAWWRERNCRDLAVGTELDWSDDVEVCAVIDYYLAHNAPAAVASLVGAPAGRRAMTALWSSLSLAERQQMRRRAITLLLVPVRRRAATA